MPPPTLEHVNLDAILEPPHQLRATIDSLSLRELADSIARVGLLEPIGLAPADDGARFTIIYGHRRFLACRLLAWQTIPALIHDGHADPVDIALAENLHRTELTPVEEARALRALQDRGHTLDELAHVSRKSDSWVDGRLRLLDYPDDLQAAIHAHGLPLTVAAHLAQIDHAPYREYLTRDAVAHGATARTVSSWVQHYLAERERVIANTDTVEQIAAQRADFVILAPCDYCGTRENLEHTRSWRLCSPCSTALREAQRTASPEPPDNGRPLAGAAPGA